MNRVTSTSASILSVLFGGCSLDGPINESDYETDYETDGAVGSEGDSGEDGVAASAPELEQEIPPAKVDPTCGNGVFETEICFAPPSAVLNQYGTPVTGLIGFEALDSGAIDTFHADFVAVDRWANKVYRGFGRGDGTFSQVLTHNTGSSPRDVSISGDFGEIATADYGAQKIRIRYHLTGSIENEDVPGSPRAVKTSDISGDGDFDLVTLYGNYVYTRIQTSARVFGRGVSLGTATAEVLETPDCDGDGDLDLAYASSGYLKTRRNTNGAGFFGTETASYLYSQILPESLAFTDVDGDGDLDAVVGAGNSLRVGWGGGNCSFSFYSSLNYSNAAGNYDLEVGDLNGDGLEDVVVGGGSALKVLERRPTGYFNLRTLVNEDASAVTVADFNEDGHDDILYNNGTNGLKILLSSS